MRVTCNIIEVRCQDRPEAACTAVFECMFDQIQLALKGESGLLTFESDARYAEKWAAENALYFKLHRVLLDLNDKCVYEWSD